MEVAKTMTTSAQRTPAQGYRTPARLMHWAVALMVVMMIPVGLLMVQQGLDRTLQNTLFILHKNFGVVVLLFVLARLLYRWRNPPVLAAVPLPRWQEMIAKATHGALYVLLVVVPVAGYVRVRAGGFPIEALDALGVPAFVPRSDALASFAKSVHYFGGLAIAALVAMHIGAAAFHGLVRRDGIFSRMWPPFAR